MNKIMFVNRFGLNKAVLTKDKWMTRRQEPCLKVLPTNYLPEYTEIKFEPYHDGFIMAKRFLRGSWMQSWKIKPRYKVGEIVAVAQCYEEEYEEVKANEDESEQERIEKTFKQLRQHPGWKNKMFVSGAMMIHRIKITNVRIERLQDIQENDVIAEGCRVTKDANITGYYFDGVAGNYVFLSPVEAFRELIIEMNNARVWEENPWEVVYTFKLLE